MYKRQVHYAADGSTLSLDQELEDDLVAQGKAEFVHPRYLRNPIFDILPPWDVANISGDTSAGLTVSVDNNVLFAGRPTIRIDVPAGTSGAKNLIGTTGATAYLPDGWDLKNLCIAVRCTNTAIFPSISTTIGDATYTNRWNKDKSKEGHPDGYTFPNRNNEWCFLKCGSATDPAAIAVTGGSPVVARRMRAKIAASLVSSAAAETLWIGFVGICLLYTSPSPRD